MSKETFHRRTYEPQLTQLKMPAHYYGFTNRILMQQVNKNKEVNLFVPVYIIMKIKNFQGIDVHNLMGNVNSVIIINILIQNLPQPLIHLFTHAIQLQINRSELLFLRESRQQNISMSRSKRMLKFTIRRTLSATIDEDTFWSPFEIIRLVVSITFNSISKRDGTDILSEYLEHKKNEKNNLELAQELCSMVGINSTSTKKNIDKPVDFNQFRKYSVSFNCMRNGLQIPISYALGCVYSLYDLAQTGLEVYHTNLDSYTEVIEKYKSRNDKNKNKSEGRDRKISKIQIEDWNGNLEINENQNKKQLKLLSQDIFSFMYGDNKAEKVKKMPKPKYSQYTHFVIPLYKYPGNSLMTIFIPLFLLSLLSLAIFFQPNDLSDRLGSIATMVLGYIALIPSIKEQLPPSSRITVIEIVIYISTLCCLFSLVESLTIDQSSGYVFHWSQNPLFIICLVIHACIFVFVLALMAKHKLVWEPGYNKTVAARLTDPESNPEQWINFYCDEEFYKANHKIYQINNSESEKAKYKDQATMICKYAPIYEDEQQMTIPKGLGFKKSKGEPEKSIQNTKMELPLVYSRTESIDLPNQSQIKASQQTSTEKGVDAFLQILQTGSKQSEKKIQKKDNKPQRNLFAYEKRLNWLDSLIASGKHVELKESPKKTKPKKDHSLQAKPAPGHLKERKTD